MIYTDIITGEKKQILTTRKNATRYQLLKEAIRDTAIQWQYDFCNDSHSYGELLAVRAIFEEYGKRYGLLTEFKENGII